MEERHGEVRKKGAGEGQEGHARTQGRHAAQRRLGQKGQEPEAGDCDRPVRSAPRRCEGTEEDGSEEVRFEAIRIEKKAREEIVTQEEVRVQEVAGEEIRIEEIGGEEIVLEEIGSEEEVGEEIFVAARKRCAIVRGARASAAARRVRAPTPAAR